MGCVSSTLLSQDDEFVPQLGSSSLGHHIVKLTSSTYGLLSLDPTTTTPPTQPPRFTLSDPKPPQPSPEVINSWDLMADLDADSFRFFPLPSQQPDKENSNPNLKRNAGGMSDDSSVKQERPIDRCGVLCPLRAEDRVVIYTTTLRGVRKTFEDCNTVRAAVGGFGVVVCERDVSMDSGFREELKGLMKGKGKSGAIALPRVFIRGKDIGGAEEVMRMVEDGVFGELLDGIPKRKASNGVVCDGCGGVRFVPCFRCNGSCKLVAEEEEKRKGAAVVVRCGDCNENGLVLCPLCT